MSHRNTVGAYQRSEELYRQARNQARDLADELQRRRTDKTKRFTANDLFCAFIEVGLSRFHLPDGEVVNTSEELRALVERLLARPTN